VVESGDSYTWTGCGDLPYENGHLGGDGNYSAIWMANMAWNNYVVSECDESTDSSQAEATGTSSYSPSCDDGTLSGSYSSTIGYSDDYTRTGSGCDGSSNYLVDDINIRGWQLCYSLGTTVTGPGGIYVAILQEVIQTTQWTIDSPCLTDGATCVWDDGTFTWNQSVAVDLRLVTPWADYTMIPAGCLATFDWVGETGFEDLQIPTYVNIGTHVFGARCDTKPASWSSTIDVDTVGRYYDAAVYDYDEEEFTYIWTTLGACNDTYWQVFGASTASPEANVLQGSFLFCAADDANGWVDETIESAFAIIFPSTVRVEGTAVTWPTTSASAFTYTPYIQCACGKHDGAGITADWASCSQYTTFETAMNGMIDDLLDSWEANVSSVQKKRVMFVKSGAYFIEKQAPVTDQDEWPC
jgi:hypothetical protein